VYRFLWLLLLPAVLLLAPAAAEAQWGPRPTPGWRFRARDDISGPYLSQGGAWCSVRREGDSFIFINDQGSWARFVWAGPNRLVQVEGQWDPSVVATVTSDRRGRTVLRFDSPNAPPGFWTAA
jgi:hypothetical protein